VTEVDYQLCVICHSPPALLWGLVLSADFERLLIFFAWLSIFSPSTFPPGLLSCVWLFVPASLLKFVFPSWIHFLVCPILSLLNPTIVHGGERYSAHEQDMPPHVKWATLTNEILSRITTFILGPFNSKRTFWIVVSPIQFAGSRRFQPAATGEFFVELRSSKSVTCTLVFLACPFSFNVSFVNTE